MVIKAAVHVSHAHKSYGTKEILKDFSMNVGKGVIYGLLGASGCGKTTLLNCIVGRKKLNSGSIWVLGGEPGTPGSGVPGIKVGFMPQEIALVGEFTIRDAFFYFGRILNMEDDQIEKRMDELSKLLDLPPEDRFLKNCSGGQQRRVSFAASMVHMPELLILDEPTVGVDPVLRERIWDYLVEITEKHSISVIITTHYIEEARQAHTIGLMRDGRLLAEESPARLLSIFQTDSLEDVFLILSQRQEEDHLKGTNRLGSISGTPVSSIASLDVNYGSKDELTTAPTESKKRKKVSQIKGGLSINRYHLKALLDKNWKQFYRNISGVVFLLMFPVLETLAFLLAVGPDIKDINLAIVNDESMSILCPNFKFEGSAIPYDYSSCHLRNFSCRFLTYLEDPMLHKIQYESLDEALHDITKGKVVGALYMAKNFTGAFEERLEDPTNGDSELLNLSQIKVWLDLSNSQIGNTIKFKLLSLYQKFIDAIAIDCKFNKELNYFINLVTVYGEKEDNYTVFMTPGVLITIMFFMGTLTTSQIMITDRLEGVWDRSIIAGVSSVEITIAHFVIQSCVVIIQTIEVMLITFFIFQIEYSGNFWVLLLLVGLEGLAGMSYGFLISIVSNNHSMANIISTGSFYPMIIICGVTWPLEGMPLGLQYISKCLPFTIAINSFRNVMKKGWPLSHYQVWNGMCISSLWILAFLAISIQQIKSKR